MPSVVRDWTPEMEYMGVRIPDKMAIASIINRVRGRRTMAQLAEECGVSPSTLSRLVNGKMTKPMTIEMIKDVTEHAEEKDSKLFELLARANGYEPKDEYEARMAQDPKVLSSRIEERQQDATKAQNIIMTELMNRGISIKLVPVGEAKIDSSCGQAFPISFAIRTDLGQGEIIWSFTVIPYKFLDSEGDIVLHRNQLYFRNTMQNMSGWFIEDAWEPEALKGRLHTFLFIDGTFYLGFEDTVVCGAKVNNDFSFVTVDLETEKVTFEIYLHRRDEKEHKMIFARPIIDTDEVEDMWSLPGEWKE